MAKKGKEKKGPDKPEDKKPVEAVAPPEPEDIDGGGEDAPKGENEHAWDLNWFKDYFNKVCNINVGKTPEDFEDFIAKTAAFRKKELDRDAVKIKKRIEKATPEQCDAILEEVPNLGSWLFDEEAGMNVVEVLKTNRWKIAPRKTPEEDAEFQQWRIALDKLLVFLNDEFPQVWEETTNELTTLAEARKVVVDDEQTQARAERTEKKPEEVRQDIIAERAQEISERPNPLSFAALRAEHAIYTVLFKDKLAGKTDRNNERFLKGQLEIWKGVILRLAQEAGIEENVFGEEADKITQERTKKPDGFTYQGYKAKGLEWIQKMPSDQLLARMGLAESGLAVDEFYKAADFLEAARRIIGKQLAEERKKRHAEDQTAREREEKEREQELDKEKLAAKAEFFALATMLHSGQADARDIVSDYLNTEKEGEKRQKLQVLFTRALTERGVSVPGVPYRDLEKGETTPITWDHIIVKAKKGDGVTHVYGEIIQDDKDVVAIRTYNRRSGKRGREEAYARDQLARDPFYAHPNSLDGRITINLARLVGVKLQDRGPDKNLHYVLAGDYKPGTFAVNTGKRNGVRFHNGYEYRGSGEVYDAEEGKYVSFQQVIDRPKGVEKKYGDYRVLMTEQKRKKRKVKPKEYMAILEAVDVDKMTLFADHHTRASTKKSSGVDYLYNLLDAVGCFEGHDANGREWTKERRKALLRAIEQVQYEDNKSHPDWGKNWETDSPRTILGMMRQFDLEKLMEFFEKYPGEKSETKVLEPEELKALGLEETSKRQEKTVQNAKERLEELGKAGFVLKDTRYGTVVILAPERVDKTRTGRHKPQLRNFPGAADAIHGLLDKEEGDRSAMLIWNPYEGRGHFFFATSGDIIGNLRSRIGKGERVRGTMWHSDPQAALYAELKEFIDLKLQGEKPLEIKPGLASYFEREKPELRRVRSRKEIERIKDEEKLRAKIPELLAPVPLEEYVHKGKTLVRVAGRRTGEKVVKVEGINSEDIDSQKRYNLRLVSVEYRGRFGVPKYTVEVIGEDPNADVANNYEAWFRQELKRQLDQENPDGWKDMSSQEQEATVKIIAARETGKAWQMAQPVAA